MRLSRVSFYISITSWDTSYLAVHVSINQQDVQTLRLCSADLSYNLLNSGFRSSVNALRFEDLRCFMSIFTGPFLSMNLRGCNNWGSPRTLCLIATCLSTLRALVQPFAFVNQSIRNLTMPLCILCFLRPGRLRRMVAGFLLA